MDSDPFSRKASRRSMTSPVRELSVITSPLVSHRSASNNSTRNSSIVRRSSEKRQSTTAGKKEQQQNSRASASYPGPKGEQLTRERSKSRPSAVTTQSDRRVTSSRKRNVSPSVKSSASRSRSGGKKDDAKQKKVRMDPITEAALNSISYAALKNKQLDTRHRNLKLMKEFVSAYKSGADRFMKNMEKELVELRHLFVDEMYEPHCREIERLHHRMEIMKRTSNMSVKHAQAISACALEGIHLFILRTQQSGIDLFAQTDSLSFRSDFLSSLADPETAHGVPMPEVRSYDPTQPDPYPPALKVKQALRNEVDAIQTAFATIVQSISDVTADDIDVISGSSATVQTLETDYPKDDGETPEEEQGSKSPEEGGLSLTGRSVRQEELRRLSLQREKQDAVVHTLKTQLDTIGLAFLKVMQHTKKQHEKYHQKLNSQQRSLDEATTRLKVADDLLKGTIEQGKTETDCAIGEVEELSYELRRRMDDVERESRETLQRLISESAEVCCVNGVMFDKTALPQNKENCQYGFMTKREQQAVEQAEILREAQDIVTRLWQRDYIRGREEKYTQRKSALPATYGDRLRQCDEAALVRMIEHVGLQSELALKQVMGAMDEYESFLRSHPEEATVIQEERARQQAVKNLIEKLDETHHVHRDSTNAAESLSTRIANMVEHYTEFMEFNERYARALVRQEDFKQRQREEVPSFFDKRTPVPHPYALLGDEGVGPHSRPEKPIDSTKAGTSATPCNVSLPYLNLWKAVQPSSKPQNTPDEVVTQLQRSNPSSLYPTQSTVSIVGDGRWGGKTVRRSESVPLPVSSILTSSTQAKAFGSKSATTAPAGTLSASCPTIDLKRQPPPLPPRRRLIQHVVDNYGPSINSTSSEAAVQQNDSRTRIPMPLCTGGDHEFIERQREIFQQLQ